MKWRPFISGQDIYDLCHLHPKTVTFAQEAKPGKLARAYLVEVIFSLHCFTRGVRHGEIPDRALCYSDGRETRVFDMQRYHLSHNLPAIVESLARRRCYHTGRGNFFTIEIVDPNTDTKLEYEVYFTASRAARRGLINLYVQSAYVRDTEHRRNQPHRKPISFYVILFKVMSGARIRVPE